MNMNMPPMMRVIRDLNPEIHEKGKNLSSFKILFNGTLFSKGDIINYDKYTRPAFIRVLESPEIKDDGSVLYTLHLSTEDKEMFVPSRYFISGMLFFIDNRDKINSSTTDKKPLFQVICNKIKSWFS